MKVLKPFGANSEIIEILTREAICSDYMMIVNTLNEGLDAVKFESWQDTYSRLFSATKYYQNLMNYITTNTRSVKLTDLELDLLKDDLIDKFYVYIKTCEEAIWEAVDFAEKNYICDICKEEKEE